MRQGSRIRHIYGYPRHHPLYRSLPVSQIGKNRSCVSPWRGPNAGATPNETSGGFAIKFYTDQGNWDLVGNNTPIFFLRDR